MCLGGDFSSKLRGLEDSDVMWGGDGNVVRVVAGSPWWDLERRR